MSTLYLNREKAKQWTRVQQKQYRENHIRRQSSIKDFSILAANAGYNPDDAYRVVDDMAVDVMNPIGEFATYFRLNAVAKSVDVGVLDYTYRQRSQMVGGTVSLSGQTGIITDAVEYKNAGTVMPVIDFGSKRDWRETKTASREGLDVLADDAEEAELTALRTANKYMWNGDAKVKSPDGRVWLGIKGDPSLLQETTSLDMANAATTAKQIVNEITVKRDLLRITNNCSNPLELAISQEMMSYWESLPYSINDKGFGTVLSYVEGLKGIASVYEDPELSGGKQFMMAYINRRGLHAVTGQAMSSYMKQRFDHNDPFILIKWMIQGFIAKSDFVGQKCAMYVKAA